MGGGSDLTRSQPIFIRLDVCNRLFSHFFVITVLIQSRHEWQVLVFRVSNPSRLVLSHSSEGNDVELGYLQPGRPVWRTGFPEHYFDALGSWQESRLRSGPWRRLSWVLSFTRDSIDSDARIVVLLLLVSDASASHQGVPSARAIWHPPPSWPYSLFSGTCDQLAWDAISKPSSCVACSSGRASYAV